jgi:hypothetical protein
VLSQVVLSFGIPFALVPLVLLTCRRDVMGAQLNRRTASRGAGRSRRHRGSCRARDSGRLERRRGGIGRRHPRPTAADEAVPTPTAACAGRPFRRTGRQRLSALQPGFECSIDILLTHMPM